MAKTIAFINEKGGIGKTSLCYNTAWHFSETGKKVLLIDLDGQNANMTFFCGVNKDAPNVYTIYDVLVRNVNVKKSVLVVKENLHIIPATDMVALMTRDNTDLKKMKDAVQTLSPYYDYIFIDVSPSPNRGHGLALAAADGMVVPMLPDITSLEANKGLAETLRKMRRQYNPDIAIYGIVFNKFTLRQRLSLQVLATANKMAKALDTKVFRTKVRQAVSMAEAVGQKVGVTTYDPKAKCSDDIRALCAEIEEAAK